jgi:hypothetical protein
MAKTAGAILDAILERVRGEGGYAYTDSLGWNLLSKCQRIANIHLQSIVAETAFNATSGLAIYSLGTILPNAVDILEIRVTSTGKKLSRIPSLAYLTPSNGFDWEAATAPTGYFTFSGAPSTDHAYDADATTLNELANALYTLANDLGLVATTSAVELQSFLQIGRTLLLIYPAPTSTVSLTAKYVKLTTILDADADLFELADEEVALAAKLAEISLLLCQRSMPEAIEMLKPFQPKQKTTG